MGRWIFDELMDNSGLVASPCWLRMVNRSFDIIPIIGSKPLRPWTPPVWSTTSTTHNKCTWPTHRTERTLSLMAVIQICNYHFYYLTILNEQQGVETVQRNAIHIVQLPITWKPYNIDPNVISLTNVYVPTVQHSYKGSLTRTHKHIHYTMTAMMATVPKHAHFWIRKGILRFFLFCSFQTTNFKQYEQATNWWIDVNQLSNRTAAMWQRCRTIQFICYTKSTCIYITFCSVAVWILQLNMRSESIYISAGVPFHSLNTCVSHGQTI